MAPRKRPTKKSAGGPSAKRPTLKQLQEDPIWSTQDHRSNLVHENLHAKFADPKTYENWTKEDWDEARETCLPEDAPYNEDGYSVPIEYFKYNIDWRRGVREFQEDLGEGRYEPEWQAQAHQAMEERARGDFDKFKEEEFEEFWGQKQRIPWTDLAGEAAQIKLQELAEQRYIREGDIFSYVRLIKAGDKKVLVEKDARVVKIEGGALTMAIPPGRLKFARHLPTPKPTPAKVVERSNASEVNSEDVKSKATIDGGSTVSQPKGQPISQPEFNKSNPGNHASAGDSALDAVKEDGSASLPKNGALNGLVPKDRVDGIPEASKQAESADSSANGPRDASDHKDTRDDIAKNQLSGVTVAEKELSHPVGGITDTLSGITKDPNVEASNSEQHPPNQQLSDTSNRNTTLSPNPKSKDNDGASSTMDNQPITPSRPLEDVLLYTTTSLMDLERRLVEVDGRLDPKDHRCANPWKLMRGKRNEQDLGTLFELREEYYVWKSNRMVKMPKEQVEAAKGKGKGKEIATGGVKSSAQKGAETKARKKAEAAAAAAAAKETTTPTQKTPITPMREKEMASKKGAKRASPDADDDGADDDSDEVMGTPQMTRSGRQVKKRKM